MKTDGSLEYLLVDSLTDPENRPHRRLFIIDIQVEQHDSEEILSLGKRLRERIQKTEARLEDAQAQFKALGYSQAFLQDQFEQQREYQSRPIQSEQPLNVRCNYLNDRCFQLERSKNKGLNAVNRIIQLTNEVQDLKDQKEDLSGQLGCISDNDQDSAATHILWFDLVTALEAKETVIARLEAQIRSKTHELNLSDQTNVKKLEEMKKNDWFNILLNMRALKERIVSKIREHKFKVANLDRAARTQAMGESDRTICIFSETHWNRHRSRNARACQESHQTPQPHS